MIEKRIPSVKEAEEILQEAWELNKTPWRDHCLFVGKAAKAIADNIDGLDGDKAYVLGILHDVGRYEGFYKMRHTFVGYRYLMERGFDGAARICMTHSFPYKHVDAIFGKWDCTEEEYIFVRDYLNSVEYDDYDKLIQLCDCLCTADGIVLLEKRMIEVALRHGFNEHTIDKWKGFVKAKEYFDDRLGKSIYDVLPGVVENTFK